MDYLTYVYLFYAFVALYFLFLFILIYFQNRKAIYEFVEPEREYSLSIVVPCYNEQESIGKTIQGLLDSSYKGLKKILVVDDCSTDDSYKIIKEFAKKDKRVIALQTEKNTGCAAGAKNYGARFVNTELIGFSDADSFPKKDAMSNMVGCFNDVKVGAVTSRVLVYRREKFLEKLQAIEYKIIAFTRKLLGFVGAIYVTNGPLSIYRKKAFDEVNGFDENNMTEDIEITWHFVSKGWKICMVIPAKVYTVVPFKIKDWFKQRIRWNVGGIQTISKYRKAFFDCGMLGLFILPFFIFSWFIGVCGLFILINRLVNYFIVRYLSAVYSVEAQTAIFRLSEINLSPSILIFLGIFIFTLGLIYTILALFYSRESDYPGAGFFDITIYMIFYAMVYPILLITSVYKFFRGYRTW